MVIGLPAVISRRQTVRLNIYLQLPQCESAISGICKLLARIALLYCIVYCPVLFHYVVLYQLFGASMHTTELNCMQTY